MTESIRADDVQPEPIEWLWNERIPVGMITLVAGLPGVGKSLLSIHIAAEVSQTAGVIYSTQEDPLKQVARPRLEAACANLTNVHFWTPTLPQDIDLLRSEIVAHAAMLVVIDPVAAHLTVSIYNDQDVRLALTPLRDLAEETGCSILLISHVVKSVSKSAYPIAAVGGSGGGLAGAARALFLFGKNPSDADERIMACVKMNGAEEPRSLAFEVDTYWTQIGESGVLTLLGESKIAAKELLHFADDEVGKKPAPKRAAASEFLIGYLRTYGPSNARDIKEGALQWGHKWATIRRAANEVGIIKPAGGPNALWSLPPELVEALEAQEIGSGDDDGIEDAKWTPLDD